jgi:hypothetical protein
MVQYVASTLQLAYGKHHSLDGPTHFHRVLARGSGKKILFLPDMRTLCMPIHALMHTFFTPG